jgi:hypothetical protein
VHFNSSTKKLINLSQKPFHLDARMSAVSGDISKRLGPPVA